MNAGWVAAGVRGRGLARRRLGRDGARRLAASSSLAEATDALTSSPYGLEVKRGMNLQSAQHAVSATLLWHLRVLVGWGPAVAAGGLPVLATGFEIANITGHLANLAGRPGEPPYSLGATATAWPRVAQAGSPDEVRRVLAASAWGDPGAADPASVRLALQLAWARRVADSAPEAGGWAGAAAALVVAKALAVWALPLPGPGPARDARHVLGARWEGVTAVEELARHVPRAAAWGARGRRRTRPVVEGRGSLVGSRRVRGERAGDTFSVGGGVDHRGLRRSGRRRLAGPRRAQMAAAAVRCWRSSMPWRDALEPARMQRVALVAPHDELRRVLAAVADAGVVEPERFEGTEPGPATEAWERAAHEQPDPDAAAVPPALAFDAPDVAELARDRRLGELAGEAQLEQVGASAVRRGMVAVVAGWSPAVAVAPLADRLRPLGGAVVALPLPRGLEPPTLVAAGGATGAFQRLVDAYATVPYADLNPSVFAGLAYVVMFGMMFGDVGHGLLLLAAGLLLWGRRPTRLARFRWAAPFVIGAGLASAAFGLAYGDAFGPTGLVPVLWLAPLDHATTLLAVAVAAGAGPARSLLWVWHCQPVARGRCGARTRRRLGRCRCRHVRWVSRSSASAGTGISGHSRPEAASWRSPASCSGSSVSTSKPVGGQRA